MNPPLDATHRSTIRSRMRLAAGLAVWLGLALPSSPSLAADSDADLFTTVVPPNVMLLIDNSGSMNNIVWHPDFDPTDDPSCNTWNDNTTYSWDGNITINTCGNTRTLYADTLINNRTWIHGRYLNWYFSDESDGAYSEIVTLNNGTSSECMVSAGFPATYHKYRRSRVTAAKQVLREIICNVNQVGSVRFGLAQFDRANSAGGWVKVAIDDYTTTHASTLDDEIDELEGETNTPLAETLYNVYRYFQSRSDPAQGKDGSDEFPWYNFELDGDTTSTEGDTPPSPSEYGCQKNFVVIITDGEPTDDDFWDMDRTEFIDLVGDYNTDNTSPEGGNEDWGGGQSWYLDDIAKFMHEHDFQDDIDDDQTIDVYTVGFTTSPTANAILEKTAEAGNGLFFYSNNAEELADAMIETITDILEKSHSFTAATVPSTRVASGSNFFTSFFLPSGKSPLWEGHLQAYEIDQAGDIYDANGDCALDDEDTGECNSGTFFSTAVPFWDAGAEIPAAGSRNTYTIKTVSGTPSRVAWDPSTVSATDLGLVDADIASYPDSNATTAEGLAKELVAFVEGCNFGTGVSGSGVPATVSCEPRNWVLGDIFHSNPAVMQPPTRPIPEPSYRQFKANHATRQKVIFAGANDGFLHGFDAGTWDTTLTPDAFNEGTGEELFALMPWEVRDHIRHRPIDDPADRHMGVDGSPQLADVWIYPTPTTTAKASDGSEWKTGLVAGLRGAGKSYFALDVTDPTDAGFPTYVWSFPLEEDPEDTSDPDSFAPYMGESWSTPVITKVRVEVDGQDNNGKGYERWVAVISGGYSEKGDPNRSSEYDANDLEGRSIFILDLKTGTPLAVKRFDPAGLPLIDPEAHMKYAMPATPAVFDLDFDGYADVIYQVDLGGQVFKWNISAVGQDRVNDSSGAGDFSQPNWPFKRFFAAPITSVSGTNYYKSFFFPPTGAYVDGNLWVSFGSGERTNLTFEGISGEDENNRFYSIHDPDPWETAPSPFGTFTESDLTDLTNDASCPTVSSQGYYFKVSDGEKFVTNADVFLNYVFVGSFVPNNSGDPCDAKGSGRLYIFGVECGDGAFTDENGDPVRELDLDVGMPTDPKVSVGADGKNNRIYIEKSGADLESIGTPDLDNGAKSMLYWREIQ